MKNYTLGNVYDFEYVTTQHLGKYRSWDSDERQSVFIIDDNKKSEYWLPSDFARCFKPLRDYNLNTF